MKRVDFIIIGAMKCGTTTLARIFQNDPSVGFCLGKEAHFFSHTSDWNRELSTYHKKFPDEPKKIFGEASPTYTGYPHYNLDTAKKIHQYNPKVKLIYMMRDPIERIISHYMHSYARNQIKFDLQHLVMKDRMHIDMSRYYFQLKPFLRLFPKEQFHFIVLEEFLKDPQKSRQEVYEFLGLKQIDVEENGAIPHSNPSVGKKRRSKKLDFIFHYIYGNSTGKRIRNLTPAFMRRGFNNMVDRFFSRQFDDKPVLNEEWKKMLALYLQEDVDQIEQILGRKLNIWSTYYDSL